MAHLHSHQAAMAPVSHHQAHPQNHLSPSAASDRSSSGLGSDRGAPSPAESYNSTHATSVSSHRSCSPQIKTEGGQSSSAGGPSRGDDKESFACQWNGCRLVFEDADSIYRHLCDDHVGRKSTGNLTLTCAWGDCDVSAAKRDHLTSHLRVHVPLKPHACSICNKNFKRPQDLKKHERIHTEQQPDQRDVYGHPFAGYGLPGAHGHGGMPAGYAAQGYPAAYPAFGTGQYFQPGTGYPVLPGMASARASTASAYSTSARGMPDLVPSSSFSPASSSASPHSSHLESPASHPYSSYMGTANRSALDQYSINRTAAAGRTSDTYLDYAHERAHLDTDLSTYSGLATGTKRSYDATRDFVEDVSNKMLKPDYNADMAARLSNTFNSGVLDEASLSALLASFGGQAQQPPAATSASSSIGASTSHAGIAPHDAQHHQERKPDLADVNAFLLALGRSAAAGHDNHVAPQQQQQQTVPHQPAGSSTTDLFDPATLAALGLDQIPGFDVFNSNAAGSSSWAQASAHPSRPIAQLPSRHASTAADASASYDRVRSQHGHALVPQLAPKDFGYADLRRVEPLTRAAPSRFDSRPSVERLPQGKASAESDDEMGDAEVSSTRSASTSPDATEAIRDLPSLPSMGIYPRVAMGDLSRRLPTPTSSERVGSASMSSILHAGASKGHGAAHRASPYAPRRRQTSEGMSSPSPPPTESASSPRSLAGSIDEPTPSDVYPRLPSQGMDGIAADVAALRGLGQEGASPSPPASEAVTAATRARHVQLIRDLLIAINFPDRFRARLPTVAPRGTGSDSDEELKARTLPPLRLPVDASEQRRMSVASDGTSSSQEREDATQERRRSVTPTPTVRTRTMPAISSLLNAADDAPAPRLVNEGRRHMEVDV